MQSAQDGRRRTVTHALYSKSLGEERILKVSLPENCDESSPCPVLYCHDGGEFFTHGRIATIAAQESAAGRMPPVAFVGLAVNRARRADDYSLCGDRSRSYTRFILDECLPFIEARHAVRQDAGGRFLAGVSLGAVATLSAIADRPGVFGHALFFSGAFWAPVCAFARTMPGLGSLRVWQVVGTGEDEAQTPTGIYDFLSGNRAMRDILFRGGARVRYAEKSGRHLWGFWQSQLPAAFAWMTEALAGPAGSPSADVQRGSR